MLKTRKKQGLAIAAVFAAVMLAVSLLPLGQKTARAYDRLEEKFVSPIVLDDFVRNTVDAEGDPTVTTTGDVSISNPSLEFTYDAAKGGTDVYAAANKNPTDSKRYFVLKYAATAGVKPEHFAIALGTITPTGPGADGRQPDKVLTEVYAPEATEAGVEFIADGEDHVMVVDLVETWGLESKPADVNQVFIKFRADAALTEAQKLVIKEIYLTDVAMTQGYEAGDSMWDDFLRPALEDGTKYSWIYGQGVLKEHAFVMNYSTGSDATYTVTSDKGSNAATQYAYLTVSMKGTSGADLTFAGIKEDGSKTEAVAFDALKFRRGETPALTDTFAQYHIDLDASFGTTAIEGVEIVASGENGSAALNMIKFSTYDFAPSGFGGADVTIDLDTAGAKELPFYDFTTEEGVKPGSGLNWVGTRNLTLDSENKTITFTGRNAYYGCSPVNGANGDNQFDYAVLRLSSSTPDKANAHFKVCFLRDGMPENYVTFPNLYKAPGVSTGYITAEPTDFIIDLAANSKTYMGFDRIIKDCQGIKLLTDDTAETDGTEVTVHSISFANAKTGAKPAPSAFVTAGQDAKIGITGYQDTFVEVTGEGIEQNNYSYDAAAGVLTINKDFISALGEGTYNFIASFEMAGNISFTVEVAAAEAGGETPPPDTGDEPGKDKKGCGSNTALPAAVSAIAIAGFALIKRH